MEPKDLLKYKNKEIITEGTLCKKLGITKKTLRRWVTIHKLPHINVGQNEICSYVFYRKQVVKWLHQHECHPLGKNAIVIRSNLLKVSDELQLFSSKEIQRILDLNKTTLHRWMEYRNFPFIQIEIGGKLLFRAESVIQWIARNNRPNCYRIAILSVRQKRELDYLYNNYPGMKAKYRISKQVIVREINKKLSHRLELISPERSTY